MSSSRRLRHGLVLLLLLLLAALPVGAARTRVERGVNLFSREDDIEMGREAAAAAEKNLILLDDPALGAAVTAIGQRVAAVSLEPGYPYRFRIVDSPEINAFALPGGFIYINRGILERAGNEAELAGVLAHEVAHVAARHGTNQLTKRVLVSVPLALVTGVAIKDDSGWAGGLARMGIELSATGLFMSYSRKAESQADILATQSLFDAGYDPGAMASFFAKLQQEQGRSPGKLERFFASHPVPENRGKQVSEEVARLGARNARVSRPDGSSFAAIQARLAALPPSAPSARKGGAPAARLTPTPVSRPAPSRREVAAPARERVLVALAGAPFRARIPANWVATEEGSGSYRLGPERGFDAASGNLLFGMRLHFGEQPFGAGPADLEAALDAELEALLTVQPGYRERRRSREIIELDGVRAARALLSGSARDRDGEYEELVAVIVCPSGAEGRRRGSLRIYLVAPRAVEDVWGAAFDDVLQSLRLP